MKAFWWFKENEIAGMARPGFNSARWFDFSFEEALIVGWIGQHPSGSTSLQDFQRHVQAYGAKIQKFYQVESDAVQRTLDAFSRRDALAGMFQSLAAKAELLESYEVTGSDLHFEFSKKRLDWEMAHLKERGIGSIVSLTESHHSRDALATHFDAHHFSINDLDAPRLEQVEQLARILSAARAENKKVAVHCLAGIGRTSTMLMGAHMMMGEGLEELKARVARQNPVFVFTGRQAEFLEGLERQLAPGRSPQKA